MKLKYLILLITVSLALGCSRTYYPTTGPAEGGIVAELSGYQSEIYLPSIEMYFVLAKDKDGKLYWMATPDEDMFKKYQNIHPDSIAEIQGAQFLPLLTFSDKQQKRLKKEIKKKFPLANHRQLEETPFVLWSGVVRMKHRCEDKPCGLPQQNTNPVQSGQQTGRGNKPIIR